MKNLELFDSATSGSKKILIISLNGHKILLDINKIIFCQSYSNYTKLFAEDDIIYVICKSLCEIEKILCAENFLRCHYSFLVNIKKISCFYEKKTKWFILIEGKCIPISRRRYQISLLTMLDFDIKEIKYVK